MKTRKRGGAPLPLSYFDLQAKIPDASAGRDVSIYDNVVRPGLSMKGGSRKYRKNVLKSRKRGGFVPSVMEGFSILAAKYVTPLALFSGYKLMTNRKKKRTKKR